VGLAFALADVPGRAFVFAAVALALVLAELVVPFAAAALDLVAFDLAALDLAAVDLAALDVAVGLAAAFALADVDFTVVLALEELPPLAAAAFFAAAVFALLVRDRVRL
jgi:hypothetical protein